MRICINLPQAIAFGESSSATSSILSSGIYLSACQEQEGTFTYSSCDRKLKSLDGTEETFSRAVPHHDRHKLDPCYHSVYIVHRTDRNEAGFVR